MKNTHKIGAIFYILWGVLHVYFGAAMMRLLLSAQPANAMKLVGSAVPEDQLPQAVTEVVRGLLLQHNWNLVWFGVFAVVVAIVLNWRNSLMGYWFNLVVVSLADLGFIFAILIPGYIKLADGLPGPILWLLAVIFTTIGIVKNPRTP